MRGWLKPRRRATLVQDAREVAVRRVGADLPGLDGDTAVEPMVAGQVDLAHPTGPEHREHLVGAQSSAWGESHAVRRGIICPDEAPRVPR